MTNPLVAQANAVAEDQTEDTGGFERRLIPAGPALARFIGYVEVGKRPQKPYQGKAKPDCMEVRFSFELCGEQNQFVIGEGETAKTVRDVIGVKITKKMGDKAGFVKLLKKMAYGRPDKLNFGSMLGEGFLINIVHNPGKNQQGEDVVWANMKDESYNYLIGAPAQTDAITGATTIFEVPEPINPLRLLLWDTPTKEQWASVFIDGERTVKVNGKDVVESKNWLQRDIVMEAVNFEGSPLHAMLEGLKETATPMAGDAGDPEPAQQTVPAPTGAAATDEVAGPRPHTEATPPPVGEVIAPSPDEPITDETAKNQAQAVLDSLGL